MEEEHGHAAWTGRIGMQQDIQQRHAAWACSVDLQHGNEGWASNMDMQHKHKAWRHGNATLARSMGTQ
jgi:hypothetical protein